MVRNLRAGVPDLPAVCAALYQTRDWATRTLPRDAAASVGWAVHYVLEEVERHVKFCSPQILDDLVDRVPQI